MIFRRNPAAAAAVNPPYARSQVTGEQLALACDALVNECLRRGSTDNITAMAVSLGSGPPPLPSSAGGRVLFSDGQ